MHSSPFAVCALVVLAGTAFGQNPASPTVATEDQANPSRPKVAKCASAASATNNCASPDDDTNKLPDLSPTQWLFGQAQGQKLAQPLFHSVTMMRARMADLEDMEPVLTAESPEYAALMRLLVPPPAPTTGAGPVAVRNLTAAEERTARARANQYLIEEWRQAELGVADSVHHDVLLRIGRTFDSAQAAGVSGSTQRDLLTRLDRLAKANDYSWVFFRAQVNASADSANASSPR